MTETAKHEPKVWDMYRNKAGEFYIVTWGYDTTGRYVRYVNLSDPDDGNTCTLPMDRIALDQFIGNVLAGPKLVEALSKLLAWIEPRLNAEGGIVGCRPEHPCEVCEARAALAASGGLSDGR